MTTRRLTVAALAAGILVGASAAPAQAAQLQRLSGSFSSPTHIASPPGAPDDIFVVEQAGTVDRIGGGTFLDIRDRVQDGGEQGLLSLAFAPDHAVSGVYFVAYTTAPAGGSSGNDLIVERRTVAAGNGPGAEILRVPHRRFTNHNGGQLAFAPDGSLFLGTGDGGGANDPDGNAQNPSSLLGKILRVPPAGGAPEIWSSGLRNPWRFSFDRGTGDLVIADVGQDRVEEIDHAPAATSWGRDANYGWDRFEGNAQLAAGPAPAGYVPPVFTHPHTEGWSSITGGHVIRDPALPELAGLYVYSDFGKSQLHVGDLACGRTTPLGLEVELTSTFGEDALGRIYVASYGGQVYRLIPGGTTPPDLRCPATPGQQPGPTTPTGPARTDTTAPRMSLRYGRRQRTLRTRRIRLSVRCNERCRVRVTGKAGPRRRALPTRRRTLPANARRRIVIKLSPRLTRQLRRDRRRTGERVFARLAVRATDAAGNARTRRVKIRLKR